jgi:ABC-type nitrate/sulfonate/bicarbonate transport system ATPase subunit
VTSLPVPRARPISAPALLLEHVAVTAGTRTLVDALDLEVRAGERLIVVGPNGSGKSTLLHALSGLSEPAAGRITRPAGPPGMLFQDGALWPHIRPATLYAGNLLFAAFLVSSDPAAKEIERVIWYGSPSDPGPSSEPA